jgi:hypothetical protein
MGTFLFVLGGDGIIISELRQGFNDFSSLDLDANLFEGEK